MADDRDLCFLRFFSFIGVLLLFRLGSHSILGKYLEKGVQEIIDAATMLGGNPKQVSNAKAPEIFGESLLLFGIYLINGEKNRLAAANQETGKIDVGSRQFAPRINHEYDRVSLCECNLRLADNCRRNKVWVVRNDAPGVDNSKIVTTPVSFAVKTIASDTRLIADDRSSGSNETVEQSGLAYIRAADYRDCRNA